MLESLTLRNFQSHKASRLRFHPGVNVITGASDSGKTALLRALNWAVNNRPSGDAFRSHWGGDTTVTVDLGDLLITRERASKENRYRLRDPDRDESFRALGTDVPEPVAKALNLTDLNLQTQHAAPFLLSSSPGEVARTLNRVVRLDEIDRALSAAASRSRDVARSLGQEKELESRLDDERRGLDWIDGAEEALQDLETLANRIQTSKRAAEALRQAARQLAEAQARRKEFAPVTDASARLQGLGTSLSSASTQRATIRTLRAVLNNIKQAREDYNEAQAREKELGKELRRLMPDTCPLCGRSG